MKHILAAVLAATLIIFIAAPPKTFAQTADTVVVPAMPPGSINTFIMGDTTATGARVNPNRVYELKRDSIYFFTGTMNVNFPLTIVAGPGNGALPVIEPAILSDNSRPTIFIDLEKGSLTLKQLYLFGVAPDQTPVRPGRAILVSGDSMNIKADSCVFDGWTLAAFYSNGAWNSYWLTNNVFRNQQDYTSYYYGDVLLAPSKIPTDTVYIVNNTIFCNEGYALANVYYNNYLDFDHNTIFLSGAHLMYITYLTQAKITNNIFYGTDASGSIPVIGLGSLGAIGTTYGITEAERHVTLDNNDYYWPQAMQNFWNSINDTSTSVADSIIPPGWMTPFTQAMFNDTTFMSISTRFITQDTTINGSTTSSADTVVDTTTFYAADTSFVPDTTFAADTTVGTDTTIISDTTNIVNTFPTTKRYPYFEDTGNISVDPGFPSSIMDQVDSLDHYVYLSKTKGLGKYLWWYNPTGSVYPPTQPLPENLAYSNATLQSAGTNNYALGDLNWFPSQLEEWEGGGVNAVRSNASQVPMKFELSQNYPNPFNPSTNIKVSVARAGVMSLKIYNVLGQLVKVVDSGYKPAGTYTFNVNMDSYASGVYFYTLREGANVLTKKMMLLK